MRLILLNLSFIAMLFGCKQEKTRPSEMNTVLPAGTKTIAEFNFKSIDGEVVDLKKYLGKKVLIVNTASECGYTPQYKDLEELSKKYGDKVTVLGFPCNDFGGQEPGSNGDVKTFCEKNYGVTFPLFEKSHVIGDTQNVVYKWLTTKAENGWNTQAPTWNFCKYLLNEKGELIKYYNSNVNPMSEEITSQLK